MHVQCAMRQLLLQTPLLSSQVACLRTQIFSWLMSVGKKYTHPSMTVCWMAKLRIDDRSILCLSDICGHLDPGCRTVPHLGLQATRECRLQSTSNRERFPSNPFRFYSVSLASAIALKLPQTRSQGVDFLDRLLTFCRVLSRCCCIGNHSQQSAGTVVICHVARGVASGTRSGTDTGILAVLRDKHCSDREHAEVYFQTSLMMSSIQLLHGRSLLLAARSLALVLIAAQWGLHLRQGEHEVHLKLLVHMVTCTMWSRSQCCTACVACEPGFAQALLAQA